MSTNEDFKKTPSIEAQVQYKGITDTLYLVFDENYTPYSIIKKGDKTYIKSLSAYLDDRIASEVEEEIFNVYNHAVEKH